MIKAEVVADSINQHSGRITSLVVTMPRYILAEFNTHRMFSRNSASSRAIPFKKMVEMVRTNPFIPIAWQEEHKGMQGTQYLDDKPADYLWEGFVKSIPARDILNGVWVGGDQYERPEGPALYHVIRCAEELTKYKATKQIANRLLEPFMYHTVLVTATEWENFFALRCPQYELYNVPMVNSRETATLRARSKKEIIKEIGSIENSLYDDLKTILGNYTELDWLKINKGQAEIHMMAVAEAMYDAIKESTPNKLEAGEWHIPYKDKISVDRIEHECGSKDDGTPNSKWLTERTIEIATGMAARVSYTTVGDEKEISYETLMKIHDKMIVQDPFHASPFEHCAQCMDEEENYEFRKEEGNKISLGVCRNFTGGWLQYRYLIESGYTREKLVV